MLRPKTQTTDTRLTKSSVFFPLDLLRESGSAVNEKCQAVIDSTTRLSPRTPGVGPTKESIGDFFPENQGLTPIGSRAASNY